jgi:hypothetical protein
MTINPACPEGTFPTEVRGLSDPQAGHPTIIYIWTEKNGVVHLRGTHANAYPMRFTGFITTTGRFDAAYPRAGATGPPMGLVNVKVNAARTRLSFGIRNVGGVDGFNFTVTCAGTLTFDLKVNDERVNTKLIALGSIDAVHIPAHPPSNPFHFTIPANGGALGWR